MTVPYDVGPACHLSGRPFLDMVPRTRWQDLQCCTSGPGYECGCPEACACKCRECACGPEVICDGGRPLWPERWSLLRHGTWNYRVSAVGSADAARKAMRKAVRADILRAFGFKRRQVERLWHVPLSRKLCVDGREYCRRQRARVKRRRR